MSGLPTCVLHGEELLHQLMPWQELTVMIAAGAIDLGAAFRRAATGQKQSVSRAISASPFLTTSTACTDSKTHTLSD